MKRLFLGLPLAALLLASTVPAGGQGEREPETSAGWAKHPKNPVLGGSLGTCFDVAVLKEGDVYRMWFSWRPKRSIARVESRDGVSWGEPLIDLGPDKTS